MVKNTKVPASEPYKLLAELDRFKGQSAPPIDLWHPDQVSDIDIKIDSAGDWYHEGTRIQRMSLVRLFASVLRLESDGDYYLVTPVEKCRIQVEDVPFQIILMDVSGSGATQQLCFTSNMATEVCADVQHPLTFVPHAAGGTSIKVDGVEPQDEINQDTSYIPYIELHHGLKGRLTRNVYYQLMEIIEPGTGTHEGWYGVWSSGTFFRVAPGSVLN